MNRVEEQFKKVSKELQFTRIDSSHPLDFYIGYDEYRNRTLLLKSINQLDQIKGTKAIKIRTIEEEGKKNSLIISLTDISLEEIFFIFCEDVLNITNVDLNEKILLKKLYVRIKLWKLTFANPKSSLLLESQIRGLIGELYFLSSYMIKKYGIDKSVRASVGPKKTKRDFELVDYWYEVKTKSSSSNAVRITSLTQLDLPFEGQLAVVTIDPTELVNERTYSLNQIINELYDVLGDMEINEQILEKLTHIGYTFKPEYDDHRYLVYGLELYIIDENSPILRKELLPSSIMEVSYKLDLNLMEKVE